MLLEKKAIEANHASHVSKELRKAVTRRSYLEKVYFKNRKENSLRAFKSKKTFAVGYIKKKERNCSIV